jgi:predicted alpha/beta-hydrolase family hydrolase
MNKPSRLEAPGVRGWVHRPQGNPVAAVALTHGAGSNCEAPLTVALARALAGAGYAVLRYDLPFRQARPKGPPSGSGERDRQGIRAAAAALRAETPGVPLYLAGQSYGGRQSSMVAAEDGAAADGLLLLSYPLHAPGRPEKRRLEHFPSIHVPVLFIHGTRDAFGAIEEIEEARALIPARTALRAVPGAPHGLPATTAAEIAEWFAAFRSAR